MDPLHSSSHWITPAARTSATANYSTDDHRPPVASQSSNNYATTQHHHHTHSLYSAVQDNHAAAGGGTRNPFFSSASSSSLPSYDVVASHRHRSTAADVPMAFPSTYAPSTANNLVSSLSMVSSREVEGRREQQQQPHYGGGRHGEPDSTHEGPMSASSRSGRPAGKFEVSSQNHSVMTMMNREDTSNNYPMMMMASGGQRSGGAVHTIDLVTPSSSSTGGHHSTEDRSTHPRKRGRHSNDEPTPQHESGGGSSNGSGASTQLLRRASPWLTATTSSTTASQPPATSYPTTSGGDGQKNAKMYRVDHTAVSLAGVNRVGKQANTREAHIDALSVPLTDRTTPAPVAATRTTAEPSGGGGEKRSAFRRSLVVSKAAAAARQAPASATTTGGAGGVVVDLTSNRQPTTSSSTSSCATLLGSTASASGVGVGGNRLVVDTTTALAGHHHYPSSSEATTTAAPPPVRTYQAPPQLALPIPSHSGATIAMPKASVIDLVRQPSALSSSHTSARTPPKRTTTHASAPSSSSSAAEYYGLSPKSTINEAMRRASEFSLPASGLRTTNSSSLASTSAAGPPRTYIVPVMANPHQQHMSLKASHYQPVATMLNPSSASSSSFAAPSRLVVDTALNSTNGGDVAANNRPRERTYDGITLIRTTSTSNQQQQRNQQAQQYHSGPAGGFRDNQLPPPPSSQQQQRRRSPTPPRPRATTALSRRGGSNLVFDTSSLIKIFEWEKEHMLDRIIDHHRIYIPNTTLDELDKMSKQQQAPPQQNHRGDKLTALAMNCRRVRDWIATKTLEGEENQRRHQSAYLSSSSDARRIFIQRRTDIDPEYERRSLVNDDAILGYAVYLRNVRGITDVPIVFVTEDKMLSLKASSENFTAVSIRKLVEMEESSFQLLDQ
ncbi:Hypothetical protein, putative [Bodo saltans]|uniref:PIN domain-containing protein n=1 Tax=Bodo saltans TaxID=75058 RepID=A0A0S4JX09_BODSA|nr:Hypothetical protein, putative [Bodo saltans]|eukprot:CUG93686.1 Hypothetical protein, putative [Bodo saltans]